MGRRIVMTLAMSIDGYIADEDGGFGWIHGDGSNALNTQPGWDFGKFLERIDLVVMGGKCYDQKLHEDFKDKQVYVATSRSLEDHDNVRFIRGDVAQLILEEKERDGKDIYLFGGGVLLEAFFQADIIDEYIIGIVPVILGKGRPLFVGETPTIPLKLDAYTIDEGLINLYYSRKRD